MRIRTGVRAALRIFAAAVAFFSLGCSHRTPAEAYQDAWTTYVHGDIRQAAEAAHRGGERSKGDLEWFWKFRLLEAEALWGQSLNNRAIALVTDPVPPRPELSQLEVRRLIDLAGLRSREATKLLDEARQKVTDPEMQLRIHLAEGSQALDAGRYEIADAANRAALQLAAGQPDGYWLPFTLKNLCYSSRTQGRYEEAVEFGTRAVTVAGRIGAQRVMALADSNLVSAYQYLGDFDSALKRGSEAVRILESIGARRDLMIALGELGAAYYAMGELNQAVTNYQPAFEIARNLNDTRNGARHADNLSLAFAEMGKWDAAAEWNENASQLAAGSGKFDPYRERTRARIEYGRDNFAEASRICNELLRANPKEPSIRWAVYDLLGEIEAAQGDYVHANRDFESALKVIDDDRSDISDPNNRITLLSRLIPFYREYVDVLVRQGDNFNAVRVAESSRARVLSERLGRRFQARHFSDLASLQAFAKSSNSYLLSFWLGPRRSFAWLITATDTTRIELPRAGELEKLVTDYRALVEHSLWDPISSKKPAVAALSEALLAKIAPLIPKNTRVIVIPDGALHRLNLETLMVPSPQPHYWIEDVELAVAPSLTIAMTKAAEPPRDRRALLLMGAPDYAGTSFEPLKGAETEVRDIQGRFAAASPVVYTGAQATPDAYRKAGPAGFSLIHFAAHAEANAVKPLESAVILSHDKLYARDVIDLPIHADLVTLSACHSAGSRAYAGEGLMGFAWAFLQAGARAVVAGLWDASDESTASLMDQFYTGVAAKQRPSQALRNAKLALLRGDPKYRKPFHWGPFQVYLGSSGM